MLRKSNFIIIFTVLFISTNVYAENTLINIINKLNRTIKKVGTNLGLVECTECMASTDREAFNLRRACIADICSNWGYTTSLKSMKELVSASNKKAEESFNKIMPKLERLYDLSLDNNLKGLEAAKNFWDSESEIVGENKAVTNLVFFMLYALNNFFDEENNKFSVTRDQLATKGFTAETTVEFTAAAAALNSIKFIEEYIYPLAIEEGRVRAKERAGERTVEEVVREDIESSQKVIAELKSHARLKDIFETPFMKNTFNQEAIDAFLSGDDVSDETIEVIYDSIDAVRLFAVLKNDKLAQVIERISTNSIRQALSKYNVEDWLSQQIEQVRKVAESQESKGYFIDQCRAVYTQSYNALLDGAERQRLVLMAKQRAGEIETQLASILSSYTTAMIKKQLKDTKYIPPQSKEAFRNIFDAEVEKSIESLAEDNKNNSYQKFPLLAIRPYYSEEGETPLDELVENCVDSGIEFVSDYSYDKGNEIRVSWEGYHSPFYLEGVLAHELGHKIFGFMEQGESSLKSVNYVKSVRSCLSEKQPVEIRGNDLAVVGESQKLRVIDYKYTEEDWADAFAAKMSKSNKNLWCYVVHENSDVLDTLSLVNEDGEDTHSSDLYRLLNIQIHLSKSIPDSCNQLLSDLGQNFDDKKCFASTERD